MASTINIGIHNTRDVSMKTQAFDDFWTFDVHIVDDAGSLTRLTLFRRDHEFDRLSRAAAAFNAIMTEGEQQEEAA